MGIDAELLIRNVADPVTDEQLREWNWYLINCIGKEAFYGIDREKGVSAIVRSDDTGLVYYQDGPTIGAKKDECLLRLKLMGRYFGEGYERGDILTYCAIAEWIEQNIPNAEVWYGGDSAGIEAYRFDEAERKRLKAHLYSKNGRDYYRGMGFGENGIKPDISNCQLCIPNEKLIQNGAGQTYRSYFCKGCGESFITNDSGATWTNKENV